MIQFFLKRKIQILDKPDSHFIQIVGDSLYIKAPILQADNLVGLSFQARGFSSRRICGQDLAGFSSLFSVDLASFSLHSPRRLFPTRGHIERLKRPLMSRGRSSRVDGVWQPSAEVI